MSPDSASQDAPHLRLIRARRAARNIEDQQSGAFQRELSDDLTGWIQDSCRTPRNTPVALAGDIGGNEPEASFTASFAPDGIVRVLERFSGFSAAHIVGRANDQGCAEICHFSGSIRKVGVIANIDSETQAI